jgi:exosortase E/protease (VPEID-CTERM system)
MPARFWLRWLNRNPRLFPAVITGGVLAYAIGRHGVPLLAANMATFTDSLERSTLTAIAFLLRLFTKNVVFEPQNDLIGTPNFAVYIDHGCAGWEGSGLFIALFSTYLWLYRRELRFPQVLLLLPVGAALLWGLNAIRVVALILIGQWSESLAMGGFHSVAGWLLFNAITLTLVVASRHWRLFAKTTASRTPALGSSPATPYLAPLVLIIATSMITKLFPEGSEVLYPCRVIVGAGAIWHYRKQIPFRPAAFRPAAVLGALAFAIWIIAVRGTDASATNVAASLGLADISMFGKAVWIVARVTGAILVVPIAEELAFRGYLIRKLVSPDFITVSPGHFTWFSFIGSSILFGALHGQWLTGILMGMTFAVAVYRRKSIADAVLAHGIANGLVAGYVLWTGEWLLWN